MVRTKHTCLQRCATHCGNRWDLFMMVSGTGLDSPRLLTHAGKVPRQSDKLSMALCSHSARPACQKAALEGAGTILQTCAITHERLHLSAVQLRETHQIHHGIAVQMRTSHPNLSPKQKFQVPNPKCGEASRFSELQGMSMTTHV